MILMVKLIGILIVSFCIAFLASPDFIRRYIKFWSNKTRFYIGIIY